MDTRTIYFIHEWLKGMGVPERPAYFLNSLVLILIIILLAYLSDIITRRILISIIGRYIKKSKSQWDDALLNNKFFARLAHFAPAIVIYTTIGFALPDNPQSVIIIRKITYMWMIFLGLRVIDAFINSLHEIYNTLKISRDRPIKSYVQVTKIIIYSAGILIILSTLLNREVGWFLAGIGTFLAVLILIFKDAILGLVAGVQISANDMVRIGDWIDMPSRKADGTVIDISLNTVKVQNWDKTISTIPTYAMVSESFNNWRGMEESGGRRIKRSINIDMKSIGFPNAETLQRLKKIQLVKDYIDQRQAEIDKYNREHEVDMSMPVNGRRMTNIGIFRKYVEQYLINHPKVRQDMTFLVRHLQPNEKGLPLEIYVFCNDQVWANYEGIQADIFDHFLAVLPQFGLRVFQFPTGEESNPDIVGMLDAGS
jgi:miniconductance mechanosensitive channel